MPVGPGHEQIAGQALQSVMLAANASLGPFSAVHVIVGDDTAGEMGRSAARNAMVNGVPAGETNGAVGAAPWMQIFSTALGEGDLPPEVFASDWLFFLDADDVMCCPQLHGDSAFATMELYAKDYDAIWGQILELHPNGDVMRRKQVDRITSYSAYVKTHPALSCQMGHFVRRQGFLGFNEELDVCEDIDLYLREWKELKCIKQEKALFLNRRGAHSWMARVPSARRRHTGREWSERANEMLKAARSEL